MKSFVRKVSSSLVYILSIIFFFVPLVSAQTDSTTTPSFGGLGLLIWIFIIYQARKKSKEMDKEELTGVDGWLLFLIISLFVSGILMFLPYFVYWETYFQATFTFIDVIAEIVDVVVAVSAIYIAIRMLKYDARAVKWVKIWLILTPIWDIANAYLYPDDWFAATAVMSVVYSIIWLSYLHSSKRVDYTYRKGAIQKPVPKSTAVVLFVLLFGLNGMLFWGIASTEMEGLETWNKYYGTEEGQEIVLDYVDSKCSNVCSSLPDAYYYQTGTNQEMTGYVCECLNENNELVDTIEWSAESIVEELEYTSAGIMNTEENDSDDVSVESKESTHNLFPTVRIESCESPKTIIGGRCCQPSVLGNTNFCAGQDTEFDKKWNAAIESNQFTTKNSAVITDRYSFKPPVDYLWLRDIQMGDRVIEHSFFAQGDTWEDSIEIQANVIELVRPVTANDTEIIREWINDSESLNKYVDVEIIESEVSEFTNDKGVMGFKKEEKIYYDNQANFRHTIVFYQEGREYLFEFSWYATPGLQEYVTEFSDMVDAFKFQ